MADNVFTINDLSFSYGTNKVIDNLNMELAEGKITTLIGANGCGKSTLFNLLTKNLKSQSGSISLYNENIDNIKLKEFAQKIAIVHQYNTAPSDITVEKLVGYGRTPYMTFGISKDTKADEEKVRWALEITNTYKHKDKAVANLSGGQKQRVFIAMALAQDTKVLFLDEPTTYLDIRYQLQILKLIRRLNKEFGMTIVMVLHDINQALYYSDEIAAMRDGQIAAKGKPDEIITSELINKVYGVNLDVEIHNNKPFVISWN